MLGTAKKRGEFLAPNGGQVMSALGFHLSQAVSVLDYAAVLPPPESRVARETLIAELAAVTSTEQLTVWPSDAWRPTLYWLSTMRD
jgi:hypothetical protein